MRILLVTNGKYPIEDLLTFSKQFMRCSTETTTLLTVMDPFHDRTPCQNNTIFHQARKILKDKPLLTKTRIGQLVEEVLAEINENGYDLVLVSEGSNHLLKRLFHTSQAVRIAELAPCPVIVLKGETRPIQHILLCDSGAEKSRLLSRFTAQLADYLPGEEEVTILHVMSQMSAGPGVRGRHLRAEAGTLIDEHTIEGELLSHDTDVLVRPGVHPFPKVRHGLVVDEILAEAQDGDYDLVVIGAFVSEGWGRFLLDDLAHLILTQMDRPVLVIR